MSILSKLAVSAGKRFNKPVARALYNATLQSPTGKKFQRWVPLAGTFAYVVVTAMRIFGIAGSETALDWLRAIGVQSAISETEITIALTGLAGLTGKTFALWLKAQGEIVPPNSAPVTQTEEQWEDFLRRYNALRTRGLSFEEARRLALVQVMEANAPVPMDDKFHDTALAEAHKAEEKAKAVQG